VNRREFSARLASAALCLTNGPLSAEPQQSAAPIVGFLNGSTSDGFKGYAEAFRLGLKEAGYTESQNVAIEYRWAEGHYERLPELISSLLRRKVTIIAACGTPAALAAKAAAATVPVVFETAGDPVALGLVAGLNTPGNNITGVTQLILSWSPNGWACCTV
jgi:ABC-type uncharacterized transport system substrate-binding protein